MSGAASRRKGVRGELEVRDIYRAAGFEVHRTPLSGAAIHLRGDLMGVPGVHCEVKRQERLNVWDALAQTERDCPPGWLPALHFRRARSRWYVVVPLEEALQLAQKYPSRGGRAC